MNTSYNLLLSTLKIYTYILKLKTDSVYLIRCVEMVN